MENRPFRPVRQPAAATRTTLEIAFGTRSVVWWQDHRPVQLRADKCPSRPDPRSASPPKERAVRSDLYSHRSETDWTNVAKRHSPASFAADHQRVRDLY